MASRHAHSRATSLPGICREQLPRLLAAAALAVCILLAGCGFLQPAGGSSVQAPSLAGTAEGPGAIVSTPSTPAGQSLPVPVATGQAIQHMPPPMPEWTAQKDQWDAENEQGTLRIVQMEGGPGELIFFYAMQSSNRGVPRAAAVSSGGTGEFAPPAGSSLKVTSVQPLGQLAQFDVGVVHVSWEDHQGQVLALEVSPPGANEAAWRIAPARQVGGGSGRGPAVFSTGTDRHGLGLVDIACPCGPQFFKLALLGRSPRDVPIIYVKVDRDMKVSVVTQAEYEALMPPRGNGPPAAPTSDVEHPYFAPTYPPTATP